MLHLLLSALATAEYPHWGEEAPLAPDAGVPAIGGVPAIAPIAGALLGSTLPSAVRCTSPRTLPRGEMGRARAELPTGFSQSDLDGLPETSFDCATAAAKLEQLTKASLDKLSAAKLVGPKLTSESVLAIWRMATRYTSRNYEAWSFEVEPSAAHIAAIAEAGRVASMREPRRLDLALASSSPADARPQTVRTVQWIRLIELFTIQDVGDLIGHCVVTRPGRFVRLTGSLVLGILASNILTGPLGRAHVRRYI